MQKGKVVSIPAKKVTEGMQIYCDLKIWSASYYKNSLFLNSTRAGQGMIQNPKLEECKIIAIECFNDTLFNAEGKLVGNVEFPTGVKTQSFIQLKNSQWQLAVDKEMVDTDKPVSFLAGVFEHPEWRKNGEETLITLSEIIYYKDLFSAEQKDIIRDIMKNFLDYAIIPHGNPELIKGKLHEWVNKNI